MKLDTFQQFVKDGGYEPDLDRFKAKHFVGVLAVKRFEGCELSELLSNIEGSLDMSDFVECYISNMSANITEKISRYTKNYVNELIKTTLKEIEDIEAVNEMEPEDCMDADKRNWELHRDD